MWLTEWTTISNLSDLEVEGRFSCMKPSNSRTSDSLADITYDIHCA